MREGFSKQDTLALKGVALMLLLCHHLFTGTDQYVNYFIYYTEEDSFNITAMIAQYAKLCVPMFAMLGAYGLSVAYGRWLAAGRSRTSFAWNRYLSLFAGFVVIFGLGLGVGALLGRSVSGIYGKGPGAWLYMLLDGTGLSGLVYTPTANATWWYMGFAVVQVVLLPMMHALVRRFGLLAVLGFSGFVLIGQHNYMLVLLFSSMLGIYLAEGNGFARARDWRITRSAVASKAIKFVLYLLAFAATVVFCEAMPASGNVDGVMRPTYFRFVGFDVFALLLCGFLFEFVLPLKPLRFALAFLGRHSGNVFMLHTFLYAYFFMDFYYGFEEPEYIFGMLLVTSVGVSVVLEALKALLGYNRLETAVRARAARRLNPAQRDTA
jgi:hypothetical protein